jgi:hypothetical protein
MWLLFEMGYMANLISAAKHVSNDLCMSSRLRHVV